MPRYIDADKLIEFIDFGHLLRSPTELAFSDLDVMKMIKKQPTADVRENIHAQKVIGGGEHDGATCWIECSHCHGTVDLQDMFCKHCGAVLEYEK